MEVTSKDTEPVDARLAAVEGLGPTARSFLVARFAGRGSDAGW